MQTININKRCCLSGPLKLNWKKPWRKRSERGMPVKSLEGFKGWVIGGTLLPLALLVACQPKQGQKPPVPVKVATVELHAPNSGARYSATIISRTQVELAFKVDGYVEALERVRGVDGQMRDLQEGDPIVAGAVLARVRQSEYQVKVKEAESKASEARSAIETSNAQYQEALSAIESSKAQLADAEAAYEKAKLDFDRAQNLFASQSLTKANYDAAKAQLEEATAKVAAARSQVGMIQARADSAKSQVEVIKARSTGAQAVVREKSIPLQDTALKAPLNGFVLQKSVEKGTLVSPGKTGFVVADTSSVKAAFGVADIAVPEMKLGSRLSVETETMPGTEFQGQITSVFPAADPKSRVFNVEVTIPNPKALLRPGMIVSLRVGRSEAEKAQPVVPLNAIVKSTTHPNAYAVFIMIEQGGRQIARVRDVKLGETYGNTIAVSEGVKEGDRVITTGVTLVRDGEPVKVIP
jgi:multidrug efflux system membrane fusion protein